MEFVSHFTSHAHLHFQLFFFKNHFPTHRKDPPALKRNQQPFVQVFPPLNSFGPSSSKSTRNARENSNPKKICVCVLGDVFAAVSGSSSVIRKSSSPPHIFYLPLSLFSASSMGNFSMNALRYHIHMEKSEILYKESAKKVTQQGERIIFFKKKEREQREHSNVGLNPIFDKFQSRSF